MRVAVLSFHSHSDRSYLDDRELAVLSGHLRSDGLESDLVVVVLDEGSGVTGGEPNEAVLGRLRETLGRYDLIAFQRVWRPELVEELRAALPGKVFAFCEGEHPLERVPADFVCARPVADSLSALARHLERREPNLPAGVAVPGGATAAAARALGKLRPFAPNLRPLFVNPAALPASRAFTLLGNEGCPYQADARDNPLYAGVSLPAGMGRGCAFCTTGNHYARRPDVVGFLLEQLGYVVEHAPEQRLFVLKDQNPFAYLDDLIDACRGRGIRGVTFLLETRADWFLKGVTRFVRALSLAREAGLVIAPYLVGIENFSQAELDRFNKGISAAQNEEFLAALWRWKAEYGAAFELSHASFGFVLFTPWTTLADLRENHAALARTRFHELRGKLLLSRARLYPDTALYYLAERDGLLEPRFASPDEDNSRRFGYLPAHPWRFLHAEVAHFSRLATELAEERGGRDELALFDVLLDAAKEPDFTALDSARLRARLAEKERKGASARPARTARVVTNLRCNQACRYCTSRSPSDDPAAIAARAIVARIDEAARSGAEELVFTGGEPTLRKDLVALVARAHASGFRSITLETNATQLDGEFAAALASAGVSRARVNLAFWGAGLDELTQDPGGFEATRRGLAALEQAGVTIEITTVVVRSTLARFTNLPGELAREFPSIKTLFARLPVESPDASELVPLLEAVPALGALESACRAAGLRLVLERRV
ncbi:MAG TPA: radical SAM protein [Polyangiaceae bacterium]